MVIGLPHLRGAELMPTLGREDTTWLRVEEDLLGFLPSLGAGGKCTAVCSTREGRDPSGGGAQAGGPRAVCIVALGGCLCTPSSMFTRGLQWTPGCLRG